MKKIILGLGILGFMGCAQNNIMEIEGRLAVKGSSVHTYLTIEDEQSHKYYQIQNRNSFDLDKRQNQTVKVKAKLIKKAVGPGFPAVIEILEVE